MKCFVCGKELESGKYILNTYLCRSFCSHECEQKYIEKRIGKAEPTTAEMMLDGAEKTGYIEAIRLVKNRKWSVTIGGYHGLSEKLSEAILIAYKEAIRNEEINDLAELGKEE